MRLLYRTPAIEAKNYTRRNHKNYGTSKNTEGDNMAYSRSDPGDLHIHTVIMERSQSLEDKVTSLLFSV